MDFYIAEVLKEARDHMQAVGDHKFYVEREKALTLIRAGAKVIVNRQQITGPWLTEFLYDGVHFTHASADPLIPETPVTN